MLNVLILSVFGQVATGTVASPLVAVESSSWLDDFAGSQVFVQTDASLATLAPGLLLSRNPTVETTFFFTPRYALGTDWQLRGRIALGVEWTDSDSTDTKKKPELSDTTLQLYYRGLPPLFGVRALLGAQAVLPTSDASRARTMRLSPGLLAQVSRAFELPSEASLLVLSTLGYQRPLYAFTTPGLDDAPSYAPRCRGDATSCVEQASGLANARDIFSWNALVSGQWGPVSPAILLSASHQVPYAFEKLPGTRGVEDPTTVRVLTSFSIWLDYTINHWATAELGYAMSRNIIDGDGRFGNPLWDRHEDMRLYLGLSVAPDQLFEPEGEGGVVRE